MPAQTCSNRVGLLKLEAGRHAAVALVCPLQKRKKERLLHLQIRASVRTTLAGIIKRVGVTSIMVTHDQEEAFDLADRVIVFNR